MVLWCLQQYSTMGEEPTSTLRSSCTEGHFWSWSSCSWLVSTFTVGDRRESTTSSSLSWIRGIICQNNIWWRWLPFSVWCGRWVCSVSCTVLPWAYLRTWTLWVSPSSSCCSRSILCEPSVTRPGSGHSKSWYVDADPVLVKSLGDHPRIYLWPSINNFKLILNQPNSILLTWI